MAASWPVATVSKLQYAGVLLVVDGNHGEYRPRPDEFVNEGVAFIRAADMDSGRVLFESAARINETARARITKGIGAPGDVLLSHKGTVGKVSLVRNDAPPFVCSPQTTFWRTLDETRLDRRYLYAFLRSPGFHAQLATRAGETDMAPYVSLTSQRGLSVPLPPIQIQRAIASILGMLDDKIELNRRMNETLEAMARALFKSWFVDFDPVRAKAEGRDPGLPQPLADLFPARLVDSELGEIPEGWRPSKLGAEVETVLGGTPSRTEPSYWGGDIPWINSGKANEFRVVEPSEFISREGLASSATKMLPSRSTIIAITGATLGQISLTEIDTCANQSIVGVLGTSSLPSEYLYFWTKEHVDELIAWQTGGAQQHINKNNVNDLPVVCPDASVIAAYIDDVRPGFDRIRTCCLESRTLATLRDVLLLKLISGELYIKDVEGFIGRVT